MRARTVILALGGVLFINTLIIAGAWWWLRPDAEPKAVEMSAPRVEAEPANPEPAPALILIAPMAATNLPPVTVPAEVPVVVTPPLPAPSLPAPAKGAAWAEFSAPRDGESVPRRFSAAGRCGDLPPGTKLMLVVDSGTGVFSPKLPPVTVSEGHWSGSANEHGAPVGGYFSLCLYAVSDEAVAHFTEWHAQGRTTGKYPPFRGTLPGATPLARIKLRVASR